MKKALFTFALVIITHLIYAQCPDITSSSIFPACPGNACDKCSGESFTINVQGGDLPDKGTVDYYFSDMPGFNPYLGEGTKIGSAMITTTNPKCRICPVLIGFMIDACGTEADNEYIVIWTGSGFNTNDFTFDYDANNNGGAGNGDIGGGGCGITGGNPGVVTGCTAISVGANFNLPANAFWIVSCSSAASTSYDFSSICGSNCTQIFISASTCDRTIGGFSNNTSSGNRTQAFGITGCSCGASVTYSTDDPTLQGDGDCWAGGLLNAGCAFPGGGGGAYIPATSSVAPFSYTIPTSWCGKTYEVVGILNPRPDQNCCTDEFTDRYTFTIKCPTANPASLQECESQNGMATFKLEEAESTINPSGSGAIQWYKDMAGTQKISSPYTTGSTTIYAQVIDGNCKSPIVAVSLTVLPKPIASPTKGYACDEGNKMGTFDLTSLELKIKKQSQGTVTFYSDRGKMNPISSPYVSTTTIVYATINNGKCESEPVEINLIVDPIPVAYDAYGEFCDDGSGFATVRLINFENQFGRGQTNLITFYGDSALTKMIFSPFTIKTKDTTIYVVLVSVFANCVSNVGAIHIKILKGNEIPVITKQKCESNNNNAIFDLKAEYNEITKGDTSIKLTWYADSNKLRQLFPPINVNGTDTIYAFLSKIVCNYNKVQVILKSLPKPYSQDTEMKICADSLGLGHFDLNTIVDSINGGNKKLTVYFSADSTLSNPFNAKTIISLRDTIYAFTDNGECKSSFSKVILSPVLVPILGPISNVQACDYFILPKITGKNIGMDAAYFTTDNGNGTRYLAGDTIKNTTLLFRYVFNGDCIAQDDFNITINKSPNAGNNQTISVCDGTNVDLATILKNADPGGVFTDIDKSGSLNGTIFNTTGKNGKKYKFSYQVNGIPPCTADLSILEINVVKSVSAGIDSFLTLCNDESIDLNTVLRTADAGGQFILLSNNQSISNTFDASIYSPGLVSIRYTVGDGIVCPKDDAQIIIQILPKITITNVNDLIACDFIVLPQIQGTNVDSGKAYYILEQGGPNLKAGDTIFENSRIFIHGVFPGYCEDEKVFSVTIDKSTTEDVVKNNLCPNETLTVGNKLFDINNPQGQVILKSNITGCDSIINVKLTYVPGQIVSYKPTICEGGFVIVNGNIYDKNHSSGIELLKSNRAGECDTVLNVDLKFIPATHTSYQPNLCAGGQIKINNKFYNERNKVGTDTFKNILNCDSIIDVSVVILPRTIFKFESTLCDNEFMDINGTRFDKNNPSQYDTLKNAAFNGCDSIVDISFQIYPPAVSDYASTHCDSEFELINGVRYDKDHPSGQEILKGKSWLGCDSTINVKLNFVQVLPGKFDAVICAGDSIIVNGTTYNQQKLNGIELLKAASQAGCDSSVAIQLAILPPAQHLINGKYCADEEIIINSRRYNKNNPKGIEIIKSGSKQGCDSIIDINLDFLNYTLSYNNSYDIVSGQSLNVNITTNMTPVKITWLPVDGLSCADCLNPIVNTKNDQVYTFVFTDSLGCELTGSIKIQVKKDFDIYVPNSFSPNGDALNEVFKLISVNDQLTVLNFSIFDRWGENIYEEHGTTIANQKGWDGTYRGQKMNPAVYVYYYTVELPDKSIKKGFGDLTLIK